MPAKSEHLLIERLYGSAIADTFATISLHGLAERERFIAQRLNQELLQCDRFRIAYKAFHHALDEVERFYERSVRALSALIKVGRLDDVYYDTDQFCRSVLDIFSEELDFENCSIMLKNPDGKTLSLVAGKGKGDRYVSGTPKMRLGGKIRIGEGVAGTAAATGHYVFVPDITKDKRFKSSNMKVDISSLLSVPIRTDKEVIGVINFSHPMSGIFDENMINLVMVLSNFVGQMILLMKLYEKVAHWNESLRDEVEKKTADLKKKNAQLRRVTLIDPLTNTFNRRFFFQKLDEEFARHQRYQESFSVLAIDIDNLKPVNDTFGHLAGDMVIKGVVQALKVIGRRGDAICRLGGDEFSYILLNSDAQGAFTLAQRLQERFKKMEFKGITMRPTVSIGIVNSASAKFLDSVDLYRAADEALYKAKEKRDSIFVYGEPH
jgi:diguanylate cyclase (GGDEF)-like protein